MNTFLNYLIEANLGLIFFYAIYWVVLQKEDQFTFKRTYLLASVVASLLFPFFTIGTSTPLIPSLSQTTAVQWLPEIVIYANGNVNPELNSFHFNWSWITLAYLIIAACVFTLFLIRILSLITLFKRSTHYAWKNYTVAESNNVQGVFSFFNFIFLSPGEFLAEAEKQDILRHEEVHIKKLHSIDIILIQLLSIVFWFNPIIRSYKKSLVQIHEFEADARSVEGHDVDEYCSLLAKVALQNNGYVLANHFTNSFTLKRITMMKTVRRKIKNWKVLAAALTLPLFFFVVACQDQVINELKASTLSQVSEFPAEVKSALSNLNNLYPEAKFIYLEGATEEIKKVMSSDKKNMVMSSFNFPEREMMGVITVDVSKYNLQDANGVFSVVEKSAEPKGGMEEFYKYVGMNITYPAQARKMGIEGRVFVEFVVNTDGSISDTRVLKGIGAGCDLEAERIVAASEAWIPAKEKGKIVKQRMVIPIVFKFSDPKQKTSYNYIAPKEKSETSEKSLSEIVVVTPKKNQ
jgi:TonB family protein